MMKKKRYWCDFVKNPQFVWFMAIGGLMSLVIFVLINYFVGYSFREEKAQELKVAETYYDTFYDAKYQQLTDLIQETVLQNQTLNLGILCTTKYSILKEANEVVFTCEFPNESDEVQTPYIVTTTLSSTMKILSQETNQLPKEEYLRQHMERFIHKKRDATELTLFFGYYILLFTIFIVSIKISEKHKEKDHVALLEE